MDVENCTLEYGCGGSKRCFLAMIVKNGAIRGGDIQNSDGTTSWTQSRWGDFCVRTRNMAMQGCGKPEAADHAIEDANPSFIR